MSRSNEEICKLAASLGEKYEAENTGCAQSTVAAILDALELENDELFKAASGRAYDFWAPGGNRRKAPGCR